MGALKARLARVKAAWQRLPPNLRGMAWMTLSSAAFAVHDASAKILGLSFSVHQITFMRFAISMALLLPVLWIVGFAKLKTRHPYVQGTRALLTVFAQILAYYALAHMLLADVTGIAFTRPLFLTVLAVVFLAERVRWQRWAATVVGFGGMLVMVRPDAGGVSLAVGAALLSSLLFAAVGATVRRYAASEAPITWMFNYYLAGMIVSLPGAILTWQDPTADELAVAFGMAVIAMAAQACFIVAFTVGEASAVGPLDYTRLVYATLFGAFLFSELPSANTWIGAAIIIAASYAVARFEARGRGGG
jgi:drug/metabolite transporter (DMT)-like permease